jgi:hypothetical protein
MRKTSDIWFKLWDPETGEMWAHGGDYIGPPGPMVALGGPGRRYRDDILGRELLQWSGLEDRTGARVFEGDVLYHPASGRRLGPVTFDRGMFCVYEEPAPAAPVPLWDLLSTGEWASIGNIYQHRGILAAEGERCPPADPPARVGAAPVIRVRSVGPPARAGRADRAAAPTTASTGKKS